MACRITRIEAAALKEMTVNEINACLSVFGTESAGSDLEDMEDCVNVGRL